MYTGVLLILRLITLPIWRGSVAVNLAPLTGKIVGAGEERVRRGVERRSATTHETESHKDRPCGNEEGLTVAYHPGIIAHHCFTF